MNVTDQEILEALKGGRWTELKRSQKRWFPYQLYVAARADNTKLPDWNRWFLTYSRSRSCPQGPFRLVQVQRLVESGHLQPDFVDDEGNIQAWILRGNREPS